MTAIAVHTATYLDEREGAMVVLLISNCNTRPFYSISPPQCLSWWLRFVLSSLKFVRHKYYLSIVSY